MVLWKEHPIWNQAKLHPKLRAIAPAFWSLEQPWASSFLFSPGSLLRSHLRGRAAPGTLANTGAAPSYSNPHLAYFSPRLLLPPDI